MLPLMAAGVGVSAATGLAGLLGGLFGNQDDAGKAALKYLNRQNKKALGLLDQTGLTAQTEIQKRYIQQLGQLQGNLTDRGITNSTVAASLAQGLQRQKTEMQQSARENIALQKANLIQGSAAPFAQMMMQNSMFNQQSQSAQQAAILKGLLGSTQAAFGAFGQPKVAGFGGMPNQQQPIWPFAAVDTNTRSNPAYNPYGPLPGTGAYA